METLNEHKNRHYGIKPFGCTVCGKAFSEASAYGKHMKRHGAARDSDPPAESAG